MSPTNDESFESAVGRFVIQFFVERQRGPLCREAAEKFQVSTSDMQKVFKALAIGRVLVLKDDGEIRFCLPFSNVPTHHRVHIGQKKWWAT